MRINLKVKGMHCKACETLIIEELSSIKGISNVHADSKTGNVIFDADENKCVEKAKQTISILGYSVD